MSYFLLGQTGDGWPLPRITLIPACPVPECCKEHLSQMLWMGNWRDVNMALLQLHRGASTSQPKLPYQSHGAEENPGEGGQLVQDPQVLQLCLSSGDLAKHITPAITTSSTATLFPHRPQGLTLVPPGWFWWALSCWESDLRRLFSLTSCNREGGRKGSRPHSFLWKDVRMMETQRCPAGTPHTRRGQGWGPPTRHLPPSAPKVLCMD